MFWNPKSNHIDGLITPLDTYFSMVRIATLEYYL